MAASTTLNNSSPTICLFVAGGNEDHFLLFAINEINSGMYRSTLGNITFQHRFLYSDPTSLTVGGEAQSVFSSNYESCHAFVGPAWTTQLSAIGEWASLQRKPIVTGGATSPIFAEDRFEYVSRSIPSDFYILQAYVRLLEQYNLDLINIVYVNNEYGKSVTTQLIGLSDGLFEIQLLASFDGADDLGGINGVLDDLEGSPTSVTFLMSTGIENKDFFNIAGKRGMHNKHLWLSPTSGFESELDPPSTGGIWFMKSGEELTEDNPLGQRYMAKDPAPHIEAMKYGFPDDYNTLSFFGAYYYEAVLVAAHGLAAVTNRSDGEQVLKAIRSLSLNNTYTGVLQMDEHGDRIGARIPVFFFSPEGTSEQFAVYYNGTVDFLRDPTWPGGTTTKPTNLIRTLEYDYNYLNQVVVYGYVLMALALSSAIGFGAWTIYNKKGYIVRASQPFFLVMICIGAFIFAWSIFPMGFDDANYSVHTCSLACMAVPWLIACGWTIIFSAIYAKLHRVNLVMKNAKSFRRVVVKERDVLPPFIIMFLVNLTILLAWTFVEPISWKRIQTSETSSYGTCTIDSDKPEFVWKIFVTMLCLVNGMALLMANWEAYKARSVSTELGETRWLAMAMGSLLQLFLVTIPLLFLVRDKPSAKYLLQSSIVFVITTSILGFIFVPKMFAHYGRKNATTTGPTFSASIEGGGLKFNVVSASAQRDLDVYKDKIASLKKTIKEDGHYADTDSLFVKVGLDDV